MPAVRPATALDVAVMLDRSTAVVANADVVEIWMRYEEAPVAAFHWSVGLVETPVAPFRGKYNAGAGGGDEGGGAVVVKLQDADHGLVP